MFVLINIFRVTPGASTPGLKIYNIQTMGTRQLQIRICLLFINIKYYSLRVLYLPQSALYLIELSLKYLVQICQGLLTVRTNQNTYARAVFCERLYIGGNREVVNQILDTGKIFCIIIGGHKYPILTIKE